MIRPENKKKIVKSRFQIAFDETLRKMFFFLSVSWFLAKSLFRIGIFRILEYDLITQRHFFYIVTSVFRGGSGAGGLDNNLRSRLGLFCDFELLPTAGRQDNERVPTISSDFHWQNRGGKKRARNYLIAFKLITFSACTFRYHNGASHLNGAFE